MSYTPTRGEGKSRKRGRGSVGGSGTKIRDESGQFFFLEISPLLQLSTPINNCQRNEETLKKF